MKRVILDDMFLWPLQKGSPKEALKKAIGKNEDKIMDLNRQQLDRGLDSTGRSLGKYKNFKYKNRFQPVDLKLTGEFRNKFSLQISDTDTEIFSQDQKEGKLVKKYGKDIFGVPSPLIGNVEDIIKEDFIENYRRQIV
jgi:hypothetical protein